MQYTQQYTCRPGVGAGYQAKEQARLRSSGSPAAYGPHSNKIRMNLPYGGAQEVQHGSTAWAAAGFVDDLRSRSAHRRSRAAAEASVHALATAYGSDHPQVARWRHEQGQFSSR